MNGDTGSEVAITSACTAVCGSARIHIWALGLQAAKAEAWPLDGFAERSLCFALGGGAASGRWPLGLRRGEFPSFRCGAPCRPPPGLGVAPCGACAGEWAASLAGLEGPTCLLLPGASPGPPADATCGVRKRRVAPCAEGQEGINSSLARIRR